MFSFYSFCLQHPSGGSTRSKQPIDKNENSPLLYVVRDAEGKLVPKFADPPKVPVPVQPAAQEQQSTDKPFEEGDNYFLKRMADRGSLPLGSSFLTFFSFLFIIIYAVNELFTNEPSSIKTLSPHFARQYRLRLH